MRRFTIFLAFLAAPLLANCGAPPPGPVAVAGPDFTIGPLQFAVLDGRLSQEGLAPGQAIASYRWRLLGEPPGSNIVLSDLVGPASIFTTDYPGVYTVSLTVTDNYGQESAPAIQRVTQLPCGPTLGLRAVAGEDAVGKQQTVTVGITDLGDCPIPPGTAPSYSLSSWSTLGVPANSQAVLNETSTAGPIAAMTLVPDVPGDYVFELTAVDNLGHAVNELVALDVPKP